MFSKSPEAGVNTHWKYWNDTNDNQYMGYSLALGSFSFKSESNLTIVVGAPRALLLRGKVYLISSDEDSKLQYAFSGEQLGSYFGHSITVGDFNGDGLDDILIGAPLYSKNSEKYEIGRAYLILQEKEVRN